MRNAILMGLVLGFTAALGCSGKSDVPGAITNPTAGTGSLPPPGISGSGGTSGNAGTSAGGTAGSSAAAGTSGGGSSGASGSAGNDGGPDSGLGAGPIVKVTSPTAVSDPNTGNVLVADQVVVTCSVTKSSEPGAAPVDGMSVLLEVLDGQGNVVDHDTGSTNGTTGDYTAQFALTAIPTGVISFRCTASDLAATPNTSSDTVSTFVDHGPVITVIAPTKDSFAAQKDPLTVDFTVTAVPLTTNDSGAAVDTSSIALKVNGADFALVPTAGMPGEYKGSVNFLDTGKFPVPPSGAVGIAISAKNARVLASAAYTINVDGDGPTISIASPAANTVVGGQVPVKFTLSDPAGIDSSKLQVTWDLGGQSSFSDTDPRWSQPSSSTFQYLLDTTLVPNTTVQLSIAVIAYDAVGNKIQGSSNSIQVYLDNVPPWVDLDPGNVTERKLISSTYYCSVPFDPLGPWAPNDQDQVPDFSFFRMLVWDDTNGGFGQTFPKYSGTDTNSVAFYLQPDPTVPLLIDTKKGKANDTGACDDLAYDGLKFPQIAALDYTGNAIYTDAASNDPDGRCIKSTTADDPSNYPSLLCGTFSDMRRVIHHDGPNNTEDVIWAVNPSSSSTSATCTGDQWSISPLTTQDGWVCIAGRARDKVGNIGISPPLRVCLVSGPSSGRPLPACATSSTVPPSCTDGCTPPPRFSANDEVMVRY